MDDEPLDNQRARLLIRTIIQDGETIFTRHAREEMDNDDIEDEDIYNVLRGGWVEFSEEIQGTWRYRVKTHRMCVVIAFRDLDRLVVITAWRIYD